jgi:uncharacterized protein (TIGR00369 family)
MIERIQENFERQRLMAHLGARLSRVEEGRVEIELEYAPHLTQQHGYLHAGATSAICDSACGYAALTRMPSTSDVVSVEFKVNLLAPAVGERFRAVGRVVRAGSRLVVTQGEVLALQGETSTTILLMQATMMAVPMR